MSEFTCAGCGGVYNGTSTEKEMEAEFKSNYNHPSAESDEEVCSVCDVCYAGLIDAGVIPKEQ